MKLKNQAAQFVAFVLVTIFAASLVHAATDANRTLFEGIYKDYSKAVKDKDAKAIIAFETDDFTYKTTDGKTYKRDEANAMIQQSLAVLKTISKADAEITDIKVDKDMATITVTEKMTGTSIPDPEGKVHVFDGVTKSKDVWVKKGDKWLIKSSDVIEDIASLDGKRVN